jgi:glycosyltransferase involved in cell wall biosynthesis
LFYGGAQEQIGGAEVQTTMLARELAGRGLSVAHIVYPLENDPGIANPTLIERPPWRGAGRLNILREARAVWGGLRRADASAYIVRGSGGHVIVAAAFCALRRRPLIFSTSNDLDFDFHREDRRPFVLRVYRRAISLARRMVVQTEQQRELAGAGGFDTTVIPSFAEAAERSTEQPRHFLWANRLVDYKMPLEFLQLAEALPEARFLMIAGETSETTPDLRRRVHDEADRLPNLELHPTRPREELHEAMAASAAVVTTSRVEGMPNMFLEAWARGIPVLSLHVDPDRRITEGGVGIHAGGSMDRLVEGARALWTDPSLRAEIGERARAFVTGYHGRAAVGDRWEAVVREVVASPA